MENNKNKKSVKFQGDMLNYCDFIQVFVFTSYHHLKQKCPLANSLPKLLKGSAILNKMAARAINKKKALNDFC